MDRWSGCVVCHGFVVVSISRDLWHDCLEGRSLPNLSWPGEWVHMLWPCCRKDRQQKQTAVHSAWTQEACVWVLIQPLSGNMTFSEGLYHLVAMWTVSEQVTGQPTQISAQHRCFPSAPTGSDFESELFCLVCMFYIVYFVFNTGLMLAKADLEVTMWPKMTLDCLFSLSSAEIIGIHHHVTL